MKDELLLMQKLLLALLALFIYIFTSLEWHIACVLVML